MTSTKLNYRQSFKNIKGESDKELKQHYLCNSVIKHVVVVPISKWADVYEKLKVKLRKKAQTYSMYFGHLNPEFYLVAFSQ